ncbi:peptidase inhibitor family I36 protein [Nocardia asteroides]|uniref:peptidase inhibitor family I36 protein n=1 Tax=Nocardia asteroides TaxID=1824 RepID=UPI003664A255
MQKLFAVILAVVVGFGAAACLDDKPAGEKSTAEIAQEIACELVVPIIDAVVVKMRAGVTVTATLIAAATGLALSKACTLLLDRIGAAPDEEHEVTLDNGKGSETTKISGNTFTSVTESWCKRTGGCTGYDRCPTDYLCLFTGSEGTGKMSLFKIGSPDLAGQHIDAATVSVYNRSGKTATLFAARGHSGDTHTVATSAKGDLPAAWQSRARSLTVGPIPIPTATPTTPTGPSTPKSSAPSSSTTTSSTTTPPTGSSSSVN